MLDRLMPLDAVAGSEAAGAPGRRCFLRCLCGSNERKALMISNINERKGRRGARCQAKRRSLLSRKGREGKPD